MEKIWPAEVWCCQRNAGYESKEFIRVMGSWFIILFLCFGIQAENIILIRSWNNAVLSIVRRRNILFSGHTLFGLKCHTSTLTFQTKTHSAWVSTARIVKRHEAWSLGMGEGNKNSILFRSWCDQKWRLAQIATKSFGKDITTAVTAALRYIFWLDCEQSLRMVTRARKARARKSSEASESRGANSLSPVLPSLDLTDWRGTARSYFLIEVLDLAQPRPQGFSAPPIFFKGKALGTRLDLAMLAGTVAAM